jgi:DNA-binding NarL/FixJ family response regulator
MDLVRIFIADDHAIVREGMRNLITRSRPEWAICGEAEDGEQAISGIQASQPDIVILDITMPKSNGLDITRRLSELLPQARILIFTMHESNTVVEEVRQAGAHGIVLKSQATRDLIGAIDRLIAGGTFFPSAELSSFPKENPSKPRKRWDPWKHFRFVVFAR